MEFSTRIFVDLLRGYVHLLRMMLMTSWVRSFGNALGPFSPPEDASIQILDMIWEWYEWRPRSVLELILKFLTFFILLVLGTICAAIALAKTVLWVAFLVPALVLFAACAMRLERAESVN